MPTQTRVCAPGPRAGTVRTEEGEVLAVPEGWELLPPGDAGLTRRVKAGGPTWAVQQKVGRRLMSRGVWAPADRIARARGNVEAERGTATYARKRAADTARRDRAQAAYVVDFERHVLAFLAFHPRHAALGRELARRVAAHATPVGSGTVARTERIPVAERAEAAVVAWLRHQTTAYDHMAIPRVKGKRREVRRALAQTSRALLDGYRRDAPGPEACPLRRALEAPEPAPEPEPEAAAAPAPKPPRAPRRAPVAAPVPRAPAPAPAPAPAAAPPGDGEIDPRRARQAALRARLERLRPRS